MQTPKKSLADRIRQQGLPPELSELAALFRSQEPKIPVSSAPKTQVNGSNNVEHFKTRWLGEICRTSSQSMASKRSLPVRGQHFAASNREFIEKAVNEIGGELRLQYSLTYQRQRAWFRPNSDPCGSQTNEGTSAPRILRSTSSELNH